MYIIWAIAVFGVLIVTHELGHFMAAKACGVRVLEFAVGMGPAVFKRQKGETLYSLRILPIGGYCAMESEDSLSEDPRAFTNQSVWKRVIILVAGAAMNFVTGLIVIIVLFSQNDSYSAPKIQGFMPECPYESESGFMVGDTIHKINGERVYFSDNVSFLMERSNSEYFDIEIKRDGKIIKLDDYHMVRRPYIEDGGEVMRYGLFFTREEVGFGGQVRNSWYCAMDYVRLVRLSLVDLISGVFSVKDLSGPVGIIGTMNDIGETAPSREIAAQRVLNIAAFIAINLAVMNLLPLPALDGGRIVFLLLTWVVEKIIRRRLDPKYEGYIHAAGLLMLLALSVLVLYNDIVRLISA